MSQVWLKSLNPITVAAQTHLQEKLPKVTLATLQDATDPALSVGFKIILD